MPALLLRTLGNLHVRTGGALALVSGRLIEVLDELFAPLKLPCVGGHGIELRSSSSAPLQRKPVELSPLVKKQVGAGRHHRPPHHRRGQGLLARRALPPGARARSPYQEQDWR